MNEPYQVSGIDLPIDKLKPLNRRANINTAKHRGYRKILSTVRMLGLIEPFCICQEGDDFIVLDGYLRLLACAELGYELVPCILYKDKEAYTYNRMVNNLSGFQEIKMMRKALESLDEKTIADTFGVKNIRYRLAPKLVEQLHPKVARAFEQELLGKTAAFEMAAVNSERQLEMLKEMRRTEDYTPSFIRALVLKTPPGQRNPNRRPRSERKKNVREKRQQLVERLEEAEQQHDFYTKLYRTYSADLFKISLYTRKIITSPDIQDYMEEKHSLVLSEMNAIIMESHPPQVAP